MSKSISVSIINYRTADLTIACATSVLAASGEAYVHVIIVDNASGDGSADRIEDWIASLTPGTPITLVRSPNNTGFSSGHNIGIRQRLSDYALLLNSDAVLCPDFFERLSEAITNRPDAGLIAPQIETEDGTPQVSCFRFASWKSEIVRAAASAPVTRLLRRAVVALPAPVDPAEVEWVSFACILLNRRMIDAIGLMDEGYFLYFEDAEYCLRARRNGWSIALAPAARAVHFRGGSGPVKKLQAERKRVPAYFYASRSRFFGHRYGRFGPLMANLGWHLGRVIAQSRRILREDVPAANANEAADIWINAFNPFGPRRAPEE